MSSGGCSRKSPCDSSCAPKPGNASDRRPAWWHLFLAARPSILCQKVLGSAARLPLERLAQDGHFRHPVLPENPEILFVPAPRGEEPGVAVKGRDQRPVGTLGQIVARV